MGVMRLPGIIPEHAVHAGGRDNVARDVVGCAGAVRLGIPFRYREGIGAVGMTVGVGGAVVAQQRLGGCRKEGVVLEIGDSLTAGLLLRREEIVEFIGLRERELGKERGVLIQVIAEAAERRGVAGVAVDRFRSYGGAIAADCDSGLARGDRAQI